MNNPAHRRKPRYSLGFVALAAGCLVNYIGDSIIGLRVELFYGLETFNFLWFLQIFILPVIVGLVVSLIFGRGGKWLAHFPPLIVRLIAYYETKLIIGVPDNTSLMPMGWWGFFVILAIECAMIGGIIGEIMLKRTYGRSSTPTYITQEEKSKLSETKQSVTNGD